MGAGGGAAGAGDAAIFTGDSMTNSAAAMGARTSLVVRPFACNNETKHLVNQLWMSY